MVVYLQPARFQGSLECTQVFVYEIEGVRLEYFQLEYFQLAVLVFGTIVIVYVCVCLLAGCFFLGVCLKHALSFRELADKRIQSTV